MRWHFSVSALTYFILIAAWVCLGLFGWFWYWLSDLAYGVHWILGFPIRLFAIILGLGWLLWTLALIAMPVMIVYNLVRGDRSGGHEP